ncbi:pantoate/beta-alanine ligase [Desulfurispirillum indicum S5]|uniref:Pantothenate synthetase n=1 Tax=Desulfurispirillum indicum (strain ATCC BAA-1389 / DSM 22839 / S5) TaxID=653733 RepID=E6W3R0_DESIS|nr:pantoate/beta-alanine ligase [Desulfurispirillum indicum S5]
MLGAFWQKTSHTIGLVPTMGYLHAGHMSLVERSKSENACTVMSIFVNPTQFGPSEDLDSYPRDLQRDLDMARDAGVDYVFAPQAQDIYPPGHCTWVEVQSPMAAVLCGASRPSHFRGVTTVVTKLFHLIQPQRAYFGEKDYQQLALIRQMTRDLNMPVEIVACPTLREEDGLAMSSRNTYLSPEERSAATMLFQALTLAQEILNQGQRDASRIRQALREHFAASPLCTIDYVEIVDPVTLAHLETITEEARVILAVHIGRTRLIDNASITLKAKE